MFKKIHSNRDPRDTLYSELKKEFSVYLDKGNAGFKSLVSGYPRFVFGLMIALLVASIILAVALRHNMWPKNRIAAAPNNRPLSINDGFDNIIAAGAALKQTIRLKRQVDSLTAKKTLTKTDSLILMRDLDSLQHIRITLPH